MLAQDSDLVVGGGVEWVVGGDTHRDWHDLAMTRAATGEIVCQLRIDATPRGYLAAVGWAREHAPGRRLWAIEGTGSYGAGLTRFLVGQGEQVVEAPRPARRDRRGPKTDQLDAIRAARSALAGGRVATPRAAGKREGVCPIFCVCLTRSPGAYREPSEDQERTDEHGKAYDLGRRDATGDLG